MGPGFLAREMRSDRLLLWAIALPMAFLALSTIYPFVFAVNISLKTSRDFIMSRFAMTWDPSFENYVEAWIYSRISDYFMNSVVVTIGAVFLLLFVSSITGYALSHLRFRFRSTLFVIILAGMMIPIQVIMVPFYQLVIDTGLLNTRIGLILSYTAFFLPFSVYLMTAFYAAIPRELIEAAKIDGASLWQVYLWVMLPMGRPALLTLGILNTLNCWNDVLISLLLLQEERTLMVGIAALRGEYTSDIPLIAAAVVLGAIPVILVYLIFQRRIVSGITVGAVKG